LTSDRVTRWRILLEEYAPEIIFIKGIHNTVADAISRLDYDPKLNSTNEYNHATHVRSTKEGKLPKGWCSQNFGPATTKHRTQSKRMRLKWIIVFANRSEEDEINPLTVNEIVEAQKADITLKHFLKRNAVLDKGLELQLLEKEVVYTIQVGL
jgi:hypothetical protein